MNSLNFYTLIRYTSWTTEHRYFIQVVFYPNYMHKKNFWFYKHKPIKSNETSKTGVRNPTNVMCAALYLFLFRFPTPNMWVFPSPSVSSRYVQTPANRPAIQLNSNCNAVGRCNLCIWFHKSLSWIPQGCSISEENWKLSHTFLWLTSYVSGIPSPFPLCLRIC